MKTFEQFLATRPAFEQPRDSEEFVRMALAWSSAMLEASDFHYEEMVRATSHVIAMTQ